MVADALICAAWCDGGSKLFKIQFFEERYECETGGHGDLESESDYGMLAQGDLEYKSDYGMVVHRDMKYESEYGMVVEGELEYEGRIRPRF